MQIDLGTLKGYFLKFLDYKEFLYEGFNSINRFAGEGSI